VKIINRTGKLLWRIVGGVHSNPVLTNNEIILELNEENTDSKILMFISQIGFLVHIHPFYRLLGPVDESKYA